MKEMYLVIPSVSCFPIKSEDKHILIWTPSFSHNIPIYSLILGLLGWSDGSVYVCLFRS